MMRREGGYAVITDPENPLVELSTITCSHCGRIVHIKAKQNPSDIGGLCKICMGMICPGCVGKGCDPLEEKLRREEKRYEALRSYGLIP